MNLRPRIFDYPTAQAWAWAHALAASWAASAVAGRDDLLKPAHRGGDHPLAGHCYVSAETLYHYLAPLRAEGNSSFKPCRARDDRGVVHWWLQDDAGRILDPTAAQYTDRGRTPPYANGRRAGFLTRAPSARAVIALARLRGLARAEVGLRVGADMPLVLAELEADGHLDKHSREACEEVYRADKT